MGCIVQYKKLNELKQEFGIITLNKILRDGKHVFANKRAVKAVGTLSTEWRQRLAAYRAGGNCDKKIAGYTMKEADRIERVFNSFSHKNDPDGFLGLNAVFNVLCDIHKKESRKVSKAV